MKILLANWHVPHSYMMATSMPEHSFWSPCWSHLRPIPPNMTVVLNQEWMDLSFDATVDDGMECGHFRAKSSRRIFLQHTESDMGKQQVRDDLARRLDISDAGVVVSDHKRATMRDLAFSPKMSVIGFGFSPDQWPIPEKRGRFVTTMHNHPSGEVREFWSSLSDGFDSQTIGNWELPHPKNYCNPTGWEYQKVLLSNASVYVNVVAGHSFGMSSEEAMMMGVPLVTGSSPEPWQWAFDGWNCFISQDSSLRSIPWMRDRIQWLVEHPNEATDMGLNGRRTVLERFSFAELNSKWNAVFNS